MDPIAMPSQVPRRRPQNHRQTSSGGHGNSQLNLPGLPRFHPANFASQHSSAAQTPGSGVTSPQPPTSPRSNQRQFSDAQRQLYLYQRELVAQASRGVRGAAPSGGATSGAEPHGPRLIPAGSPGPVTPLELEGQADYLAAGVRAQTPGLDEAAQADLVNRLIQEETARRADVSSHRATSATR